MLTGFEPLAAPTARAAPGRPNDAEIAGEVGVKLATQSAGIAGIDALITFMTIMQIKQLRHTVAMLVPLHGAQAKLLVAKNP